jgi:hypothetical protein
MLKFLADENFNGQIVRGLLRRVPELDLIRVQDLEIAGADDPAVLAWAAKAGRVLLTHDVRTIPPPMNARIVQGLSMPGVIFVRQTASVAQAINDLVYVASCSHDGEWEGKSFFVPF